MSATIAPGVIELLAWVFAVPVVTLAILGLAVIASRPRLQPLFFAIVVLLIVLGLPLLLDVMLRGQ